MKKTLLGSTLAIRRTQDINIDIAALADSYEWAMRDLLYDKLTEDLDLDSDTADFITQTDGLSKTVLDLVKTEMFKRITGIEKM